MPKHVALELYNNITQNFAVIEGLHPLLVSVLTIVNKFFIGKLICFMTMFLKFEFLQYLALM
jgi:hypothetical protein